MTTHGFLIIIGNFYIITKFFHKGNSLICNTYKFRIIVSLSRVSHIDFFLKNALSGKKNHLTFSSQNWSFFPNFGCGSQLCLFCDAF